jgi:putative transposase
VPNGKTPPSVSEADWETARERERVLRSLAEQQSVSTAAVDEAARKLGLSRSFTYKLLARYKQLPQVSSLLLRTRGRTPDLQLLDQAREKVMEQAIQEFYLQRERPRFSDLIREIAQLCDQRGLKAPNYRTVRRRVQALDARLVTQRRYGTKVSDAKYKLLRASPFGRLEPLQLMQIDHTPVDVIVVDEQDRLPMGRPWLTLAIDVGTRMAAGFSVSLDAPSVISVALALSHAVMPKDVWMAGFGIDLDWPIAGLPQALHVDNGKDFDSAALLRGCQEYGIELEFRPPGNPHYGGHIERLIGTTMGAVHLLPGTTSSNTSQKGDYDPEGKAAMTLPELQQWLTLQMAGVYNHSLHSALGRPPIDVWKQRLGQARKPPRHPQNAEHFFIEFLPGERRTLQRDGIRLFNIWYSDNILSPLVGRQQSPMLIKYDPRNLSRVYLQTSDGDFWPIPYRDLSLPPISLWEWRAAQKRLKESGRRALDEKTIFDAIRQQRRLLEQARKSTRDRRNYEKLARSVSAKDDRHEISDRRDVGIVEPFAVEEWP